MRWIMAQTGSRQLLRSAVLVLIVVIVWLNFRLQKAFGPNDSESDKLKSELPAVDIVCGILNLLSFVEISSTTGA